MILFKFASNPNDYLVMMWEFQDLNLLDYLSSTGGEFHATLLDILDIELAEYQSVPSAANSSTSICDEFTGEEFHDTLLEKLDIEFEKRSMPSSVIL